MNKLVVAKFARTFLPSGSVRHDRVVPGRDGLTARMPNLGDVNTAARRLAIVELLAGPLKYWPDYKGYRADRPLAMVHKQDVILCLVKANIARLNDDDETVRLTEIALPLARECADQFKRVLEPRSKS